MAGIDSLYAASTALGVSAEDAEAYRAILSAAGAESDAAVRQFAATLLKQHAASFPALLSESSDRLLALCADTELKVRVTAIGALPTLCGVALSLGRPALREMVLRVLTPLEELPEKPSIEVRTIQSALGELVDKHPRTALLALLKPPDSLGSLEGDATAAGGDGGTAGGGGEGGGEGGSAEGGVAPPTSSVWRQGFARYARLNVERIGGRLTEAAAGEPEGGGEQASEVEELESALQVAEKGASREDDRRALQSLAQSLRAVEHQGAEAGAGGVGPEADAPEATPPSMKSERAARGGETSEKPPSHVLYMGGLAQDLASHALIVAELARWGEVETVRTGDSPNPYSEPVLRTRAPNPCSKPVLRTRPERSRLGGLLPIAVAPLARRCVCSRIA